MPNRTVTGTVTQVNSRNGGIKLDVEGDEWLDWSQYAKGERPDLRVGAQVTVEIDQRNFLRKVVNDGGGSAVPARSTGGGDFARPWLPEEAWRATLLSCLNSASNIVPSLIVGDDNGNPKVGALAPKEATYAFGLWLAHKVWAESVPNTK